MSMAVDMCARVGLYTAVRTHVASMRTSVDTHAPLLTNNSAAATCFRPSRVIRRTRTLVSTARMFFLHIAPDAFVELFYLLRSRYPLRKDCPINVFRRIPVGFAYDHGFDLPPPFRD